jgi:hypothetical protein
LNSEKAVNLNGVYLGAFFLDNQSLTDWVNSQKLLNPLFCLGDGHQGIWNLFTEIGTAQQRHEIIDWYHLKCPHSKRITKLANC